MNEKNKSEFKRFIKALKGLFILFTGICAGLGSLNYASASGEGFFSFVGICSIVVVILNGVKVFKEIWDDVNATKASAAGGGAAAEESPKPSGRASKEMKK